MNNNKLICTASVGNFEAALVNVATQSKLSELEEKLIEKIEELEQKLELVKKKQWKFQVGDIVIWDKFVFEITELLDNDKWLYKARKYDYSGVVDKAGYKINCDENCYFDATDTLIKLDSWTDYAAQLLQLAVKREKELLQ